MTEKDSFLDYVYGRMIETFKTNPLYQQALTVPQILEIKPPSEEWLKDNEIRQLISSKYVPLNEALEISRKAVDEQLHKRHEVLEEYNDLKRKVALWKQFISITITGNLDARVLQKEILNQYGTLFSAENLLSNRNIKSKGDKK